MKKYAFSEEIDLILEDEGGVIYNKLTEQFFGLDYVGNFICSALQQGKDIDTIEWWKTILHIVCSNLHWL